MADYLEVARRALAGVNLALTPTFRAASPADSAGVVTETISDACAASPVTAEHERDSNSAEGGPTWAEWKAAALNRLFQEQGVTGQSGQITAATIRHGESGREALPGKTSGRCGAPALRSEAAGQSVSAVDSAATNERPMSRPEELAE
jgi:hypothetical protein